VVDLLVGEDERKALLQAVRDDQVLFDPVRDEVPEGRKVPRVVLTAPRQFSSP
jgi:hypothetical protein